MELEKLYSVRKLRPRNTTPYVLSIADPNLQSLVSHVYLGAEVKVRKPKIGVFL